MSRAAPLAVLFDAGGTLIHPDRRFLLEVASAQGVDADADSFAAAKDKADRVVAGMLRSDEPGDDATRIRAWFVTLFLALGVPEALLETVGDQVRERHADGSLWVHAEPGTVEMLRSLKEAGIRIAVISNADGRVERYLAAAGLADEFEFILDSGTVGIEKPDRRIFDLALERLGLDAADVVYVGDSWEIDVIGAREAGIRPVYLSGAARDGAICISGIGDLPRALGLEPAAAE